MTRSRIPDRLNLGCGRDIREGYLTVGTQAYIARLQTGDVTVRQVLETLLASDEHAQQLAGPDRTAP